MYEVLQLPWLGEPPVAVIFNLSFHLFDLLSMTKQTLLFDVAQGHIGPTRVGKECQNSGRNGRISVAFRNGPRAGG